jgi:hypothetical protein
MIACMLCTHLLNYMGIISKDPDLRSRHSSSVQPVDRSRSRSHERTRTLFLKRTSGKELPNGFGVPCQSQCVLGERRAWLNNAF